MKITKEELTRQYKSVWEADSGLRAEFQGDFDRYISYLYAARNGLCKIQGQNLNM